MLQAKVKPGHPNGTYRRAGMTFTFAPSSLEGVDGKIMKVLLKDPWLIVSDGAEVATVTAPAGVVLTEEDLAGMKEYVEGLEKRNADLREQNGALNQTASDAATAIGELQKRVDEADSHLIEASRAASDRCRDLEGQLAKKDEEIAALREDAGKKRK